MQELGYKHRLGEIEELLRAKRHSTCVRECGQVFEGALRELLRRLVNELGDAAQRDEILRAERKIAKGGESYLKFGLGQLVGLYAEARVLDKVRSHFALNLRKVRRISWHDVVSLRNAATHDDEKDGIDEEDALQMYYWLKVFLYDTRLVEGPTTAPKPDQSPNLPAAMACPQCKRDLEADWRFCPVCGTAVHAVCLSCGAGLSPAFKICPYCETRVRGTSVAANAIHEYELLFRGAYLDQIITAQERAMLEQKRLQLGLSVDQSEEIESRVIPKNLRDYRQLVEGVWVDRVINDLERSFLDKKIQELKIDPKTAADIEEEVQDSSAAPA